jgi:enoyl-[acyl-carrier protein] reductase II
MKTEICDLLKIEYPIIQGAMSWIGTAELASAVSNAGGMGIISPITDKGLEREIEIAKDIADRPFGVNIPIVSPNAKRIADKVIDEGIEVVTTSVGDPMKFTKKLKKGGIKVIQVVTRIEHAIRAEKAGVDAIVAQGLEAGGHPGEIATIALIPQIVDSVNIPVIAAGGIGDGRGLAAVLMLGAEGVQIGTGFIVTKECIAHENYKNVILSARDTILIGSIFPSRVIKNEIAKRLEAMEKDKISKEMVLEMGRTKKALIDGDIVEGLMWSGQVAGLINEIMSVEEFIKGMIEEAEDIIKSEWEDLS